MFSLDIYPCSLVDLLNTHNASGQQSHMIPSVIRAGQFYLFDNSLTFRWSFPNAAGFHGEQSQRAIAPRPLYLQHAKIRTTSGVAQRLFLTTIHFKRTIRFEQNASACENMQYFQPERKKGQRFTSGTGGILLKSPVRLGKSAPSLSDSLSIWHFR